MAQQIPSSGGRLPSFIGGLLNSGSSQTQQNGSSSSIQPPSEPPPLMDCSLKSAVVVGDTIYDDDDFAPEETAYSGSSTLEQQAKLSWAAAGVDKVSSFFWGTVSLPTRSLTWTVKHGVTIATKVFAQHAAKRGVSILDIQAPEGPLQTLRHCLHELHQKITDEIEIDDALRNRAKNAIAMFLANPEECLVECYDPQTIFFKEGLNEENKAKFQVLLTALQRKSPLAGEGRFIKPLCDFIDKCCAFQLESHKGKLGNQIVGRLVSPLPPTTSAAPAGTAKFKRSASRSQRSAPSLPKPAPENPVPLILKEIEDLKSLGFRIALALLILPDGSIHKKSDEESGGLAGLIKKSNVTLGDPNEIFQNLVYTEIDNSNLNYVQKKWRKLTCWMMAPAVQFIVDHTLDQTKDVALYLIGLTPEERLKMVVKMFIEPGLGFISWLQSKYKAISVDADLGTTVDEAVSNAIDQIKIKDRHDKYLTSTDLINRLISSLIDRYAPALNWAGAATAHFEKRAEQSSSPFLALWFISWSYLTWTVNIISAPGRWLLDKLIRKILKTVVVSKIQSRIKDNGDSSLGKLALHSIYKTLYEKLQEKNRGERDSESEDTRRNLAIEQRGFVDKDVQDSISRLVSSFLKLLYIQGSDVIELSTKLSPNNVVEQGKITAMDLAFAPGIQKATEEIIHGLQIFLDNSTFSAGILDVIKDIHQQCLRFNIGNTDTNLARLENDFYVELQDAVKHGIQEVIDDKLDPSNNIQKEADLFIDGLKYDTRTFREQFSGIIQNLTPSSVKKLMQLRDKSLIDVFRRRCERANDGTNPSTRQHIKSTREHFESLSKPICAKIANLAQLVEKRKQLEEVIEDLAQLIEPLDTALAPDPLANMSSFYKGLQLTLQRIKNKTYPKPVQDLISTLQGHFDSWRTEAAKKANQTLLNGTIETLRDRVEAAINEQEREIGRINGTIGQKPLEKGQQPPSTIDQESKELKQQVRALAEWTNNLNYFVCIPENQQMDALKQVLSRFAEDGLSPLILRKLDDFFLFLGKNHNVKGMLSFIIKAYLELPQKNPKDFKKIIDKAKSNSLPPPPQTSLMN